MIYPSALCQFNYSCSRQITCRCPLDDVPHGWDYFNSQLFAIEEAGKSMLWLISLCSRNEQKYHNRFDCMPAWFISRPRAIVVLMFSCFYQENQPYSRDCAFFGFQRNCPSVFELTDCSQMCSQYAHSYLVFVVCRRVSRF